MGNIFAGSEVVEMGIQIEKNGRDFYNEMAGRTESQKSREIFEYLAQEEEKHIAAFQEILDSVRKYEPPEAYTAEYFAYMNSLASGYVFTQKDKGQEIARNTKSDMEAVEVGIKAEKDSILFYEGMIKVVPDYHYKILEELIGQEKGHLAKLLDLQKEL